MVTAVHLALREMWRGRGRFLLFGLVVALITVLVLFIAALSTGLLGGIREYIDTLDADLLIYQDTARREIPGSRIDWSTRATVRRVEGVREVGPIGFSSVSIVADDGRELLDVSLIGVEPDKPGQPPVVTGEGFSRSNAREAIIDRNVARLLGLQVGNAFAISAIQGTETEIYVLTVVGASESRKYGLQPAVFVPIVAWDEIRPRATPGGASGEPACNVLAVQLEDPTQVDAMKRWLELEVDRIEAVGRTEAYESQPGYTSIQASLTTQNTFVLLIGALVIGGFFQIQTLQKVPQIGMLKAIGTPNGVVALAAMIEITVTILLGVTIASLVILGVTSVFPPSIAIVFEFRSGALAVATLSLLGFVGGLVSVRYSLRVEPLIALGLNS